MQRAAAHERASARAESTASDSAGISRFVRTVIVRVWIDRLSSFPLLPPLEVLSEASDKNKVKAFDEIDKSPEEKVRRGTNRTVDRSLASRAGRVVPGLLVVPSLPPPRPKHRYLEMFDLGFLSAYVGLG